MGDNSDKEAYVIAFYERFKEILKNKKINLREISRKLKLSNSYFSMSRNFSISTIAKLYNLYPDINLVWLLTGKGESFENKYSEMKDINITTPSSKFPVEIDQFLDIIKKKDEYIKRANADKRYELKILEYKLNASKNPNTLLGPVSIVEEFLKILQKKDEEIENGINDKFQTEKIYNDKINDLNSKIKDLQKEVEKLYESISQS